MQVAVDQVLQRGGDEEIFLPQPQFTPGGGLVVRVKKFANRFGPRLHRHRAEMVAGIEHVKPQRIWRARRPQPQRVHVRAAPADDGRIESDRLHCLGGVPHIALVAFVISNAFDMAAEMNVVDQFAPREFPRIAE